MPVIYYGPNQAAIGFPANQDLADFQAAVFERFAAGSGFFLTTAGRSDRGEEKVTSYWMHPSIPLIFAYDPEDEYGNYPPPVDLDRDKVDRMVGHMAAPLGVIAGFGPEGPFLPFAPGPQDP